MCWGCPHVLGVPSCSPVKVQPDQHAELCCVALYSQMMGHSQMKHSQMKHSQMGHSQMMGHSQIKHSQMKQRLSVPQQHMWQAGTLQALVLYMWWASVGTL